MNKNEESYLKYLKTLICDHHSKDYEVLIDRLWRKEFYSVLPNDQNREQDGLLLRDIIDDDADCGMLGPCRVLEMLIALSKRMEWEISGTKYDKDYVDLFWELLDNLELLQFDNLTILKDAQTLQLDHILTNWLDRKYSSDGCGSLFPVKNWKKPQYKVEVWYQMMLYLHENYGF